MKVGSIVACLVGVFGFATLAQAAVKTKVVEYKHGDVTLKGYLAWDDAAAGKKPGIVVVPEWWGNNEYAHHRAEMLASLGYVGFAIDMYGDGKTTTDPKQAGEWATAAKADAKVFAGRLQAGLDTLKKQEQVDDSKLAAIGYCFGGTGVLTMARQNFPVLGVVSFHGALAPVGDAASGSVKPKVLVCHGAEDPMVPVDQVIAFANEMKTANANWEVNAYSGAVHAFTNPDADKFKIPGIAYNEQADHRSWEAMKSFFTELFGK